MTGLEKRDILLQWDFIPLDFSKTLHTFISLFKETVNPLIIHLKNNL
jgi:hypothetical protein